MRSGRFLNQNRRRKKTSKTRALAIFSGQTAQMRHRAEKATG